MSQEHRLHTAAEKEDSKRMEKAYGWESPNGSHTTAPALPPRLPIKTRIKYFQKAHNRSTLLSPPTYILGCLRLGFTVTPQAFTQCFSANLLFLHVGSSFDCFFWVVGIVNWWPFCNGHCFVLGVGWYLCECVGKEGMFCPKWPLHGRLCIGVVSALSRVLFCAVEKIRFLTLSAVVFAFGLVFVCDSSGLDGLALQSSPRC